MEDQKHHTYGNLLAVRIKGMKRKWVWMEDRIHSNLQAMTTQGMKREWAWVEHWHNNLQAVEKQ